MSDVGFSLDNGKSRRLLMQALEETLAFIDDLPADGTASMQGDSMQVRPVSTGAEGAGELELQYPKWLSP